MTTVVLDSHVLHWWSAEPARLSQTASRVIEQADELAVAAITWYELAWLAAHERIQPTVPVLSWLQQARGARPNGRYHARRGRSRGIAALVVSWRSG